MEKNTIITMKEKGKSNRWIERETGINRKTVARYWSKHQELLGQLTAEGENRAIQEQIVSKPIYDASGRKPTKYTLEMDEAINKILSSEGEKARELGDSHKQQLTNAQIHALLKGQGMDIGFTTVTNKTKIKRQKRMEAYIRQEYEYGDRLEYDFGEVRLVINGEYGKYYLAVFGAPRSSFRWAYLYKNQKKEAFLDSHVRFFELAGGAYREVVYDNMKNVVTAFIGKTEKALNTDLIALSTYYGFTPNVTNCYRGNEKGYVESSVKAVRQEAFSLRYKFADLEEAEAHLEKELTRMNAESSMEEEMKCLLPWRPPLELSRITEQRVDKYSFVRVDKNFYSVPEYLVGMKVTVRNYIKEVAVYAGLDEVCRHNKKDGEGEMSVNIHHYLETFAKKPGALKNSKALKSEPELKAVFDLHYTNRSLEFVDIMRAHQEKSIDDLLHILHLAGEGRACALPEERPSNVMVHIQNQLCAISDFFMKGRAG
jgi:transposase